MNSRSLVMLGIFSAVVAGIVFVLLFVNGRSDDNVISAAIDRLVTVNSLSGGLSVDTFVDPDRIVPDSGWGSLRLPLRVSGPAEIGREPDGQLVGQGEFKVHFGGADDETLTAEVRLAGHGNNFVRLDGLPAGDGRPFDPSGLNGVWFLVSGSEAAAAVPWAGSDEGASLPEDGSAAFQADGLSEVSWLRPAGRLPDTVMEGRPVLHYELAVGRDWLVGLIADLTAALTGQAVTVSQRATIRSFLLRHEIVAEGYVDRQSESFRALKFGLFPRDGQETMPFAVTVKLDRYGGPVTVGRPADARPLSASLMRLLSGTGSPAGGQR